MCHNDTRSQGDIVLYLTGVVSHLCGTDAISSILWYLTNRMYFKATY